MRHLTNIFRRLYRIFAHAWFQHRDVFWEVEGHDGLYVFFKTVCDLFHLIPEDNYTIPAEAEGPDAVQPKSEELADSKRVTILRKENENPFGTDVEGMDPSISTGATTRRHKHSPSTGSRVTTITESAEDSEEAPHSQTPLREVLKNSPEPRPPSTVENHPANVPPAEEIEPAATDNHPESIESAAEVHEQPQEPIGEPSDEPLNSEEEIPKNELSDAQGDKEGKSEESTETPLEGEEMTAPSADQETQESPQEELESEPKTES